MAWPKHIYWSIARCRTRRSVWWDLWSDCHSLHLDTQSDVYAMLGHIHELGGRCRGWFMIILPTARSAKLLVHSYDRLCSPKGPIEFLIRPRKCMRSLEARLVAHWALQERCFKGQVDAENQPSGWTGLKSWWSCRTKLTMPRILLTGQGELSSWGNLRSQSDGAVRLCLRINHLIPAYEIHTKVGEKAGAKVNGRMVPLTTA